MRLKFGETVLDLGTRELRRSGKAAAISPKAFQLLELLVRRRPNAVSKEEIHRGLWPETFVADGNLTNLVSELRGALDDDAHGPRIIRTVQRFGYAFQAEVETIDAAAPPSAARSVCRLIWGDRELALIAGENLLGRDPRATIHLDDVSVSRYHARIVIDGSAARLEDLGSKNGTYLRDRRLEASAPLRDGDSVRLGSVALVFRRSESGGPTQTVSSR